MYIAGRHFSSERWLSETGSRVERYLKHGLAVLVAASWGIKGRSFALELFQRCDAKKDIDRITERKDVLTA